MKQSRIRNIGIKLKKFLVHMKLFSYRILSCFLAVIQIKVIISLFSDVDITQDDGVYSHYFTNFTSTGSYNVYVKVAGGFDATIVKGICSLNVQFLFT